MTRAIRLRAWQQRALDQLASSDDPNFLLVATPGAGKTTVALAALRRHLAAKPGARGVVVVPTAHLKFQWAEAATRFDLNLEPEWAATDGTLPADMHGVVTTYQQVARSSRQLATLASNSFVVLDEVHHAGSDLAWGEAVRTAFTPAARRLSLSGTPFRSDTQAIPFITYKADEARAQFDYGYGAALGDRAVVRPVEFPRLNGHMEWTAPDGSLHAASFDDDLDSTLAAQRLRTALSLDGEWLPAVLDAAHSRLVEVRREQPDAGGLVIASDQDHARGIAAILRARHGVESVVATSDDPEATARISRYRAGTQPWIIAVRMVSEGVDIPRLRVGVFATTTTTELFFRQVIGRLVRWTRGEAHQRAYLFIPDDPRLRARAHQIAEQRRHSLRRDVQDVERTTADATAFDRPDEQLSLFAALSAVPIGEPAATTSLADSASDDTDVEREELGSLFLLDPLPHAGVTATPPSDEQKTGPALSPAARRRQLRERNAARAADLVRLTGMAHAAVNAELNRLVGLRRVTEATEVQLQQRLEAADRWIRSV